jgi:anti-sigma factor (TIGR02949 family)
VDCRKYQEQITAAVDNVLEENERRHLEAHLAECQSCKLNYEAERATSNMVKARCKRVQAPSHVLAGIVDQLDDASVEKSPWWKKLSGSMYFRPAIAFAIACIAAIALINSGSVKRTNVVEASMLPANDVVKQALANYMAVSRNEIQPQLASNRADLVQNFFAGKTEFPAFVPSMNGCTLIGGVINEFSGTTLAHVVYTHHGTDLVYVYETCWATVQQGDRFRLSQEIQEELRNTGRYVASHPDGYTVALWTKGNTLCSAVAKLDQETLLACVRADTR